MGRRSARFFLSASWLLALQVCTAVASGQLAELPSPADVSPAPESEDKPAAPASKEPAPAVQTVPKAPLPSPEQTWIHRVYQRALLSILRVECGNAIGTGFYYHSPEHVVTAFHVVSSGRDITLIAPDGSAVGAQVVAWSALQDLAILKVHGRQGVPLTAAAGEPRVGDPVLALGAPMDLAVRRAHRSDAPVFTTTVGTLSVVTEEAVQTDAAINPGNSGGPLLDEQGHVLGVISRKVADGEGLGFAVPTAHVDGLTKEIGTTGSFWGFVSGDVEVAYALADHDLSGLQLGARIIAFDRLGLGIRGAWLSSEKQLQNDVFLESRERSLLELQLFYRLSVYAPPFFALHIPVGLGFASTRDELERIGFLGQLADPACDIATEPCALLTTHSTARVTDRRIRPMATLELELSPLLFSSAFYYEKDEPMGWRFGMGLVF